MIVVNRTACWDETMVHTLLHYWIRELLSRAHRRLAGLHCNPLQVRFGIIDALLMCDISKESNPPLASNNGEMPWVNQTYPNIIYIVLFFSVQSPHLDSCSMRSQGNLF